MNLDHLSEDDISVKYITPALYKAEWDEETQIRRRVSFTKGRIIVRRRMDIFRIQAHIWQCSTTPVLQIYS